MCVVYVNLKHFASVFLTFLKLFFAYDNNISKQNTEDIQKLQKFKELIKRPEIFLNKALKYNIKYIDLKLQCATFINHSKYITINDKIKTIMKRTEYLLYGFIDLFNIKLKLDKYILKNTKNINYNQLKITNNDIKDYYELEDVIKTTIGKIETNIKKLNKTCNTKIINIQDDIDDILYKNKFLKIYFCI